MQELKALFVSTLRRIKNVERKDIENFLKWVERKEPERHSFEIWVDTNEIKQGSGHSLESLMFGSNLASWSQTKSEYCPYLLKITVEQVP